MRLDPGRHSRLPDRLPCPLLRFQDQISLMGVRSRPDTTLLRMNHCQPCTRMLRSLSRRFLTVSTCTLDATKTPRQKRGTQVHSAQPTADGFRCGHTQHGACGSGTICVAGWRRNQAGGDPGVVDGRMGSPSAQLRFSPIPSSQAWKGEWTKAHA
jgi:hypothetical protein